MIRARVVRIARHDEAQGVESFLRFRLGRPVPRPVVPGHRVHERLGEDHLGVEIIRIAHRQFAHGIGERHVQRRPVVLMGRLIASLERGDVCLFPGTGGFLVGHRQLQGGPRACRVAGIHRLVDMRSEGIGGAPIGHGALRIAMRGGAERSDGFLVVEAIQQAQALIKILLRLRRRGGHRVMQIPQPVQDRTGKLFGSQCGQCHEGCQRREGSYGL